MTQLCFLLLLFFLFFPFSFLFEYLQSMFSVFFSLSWMLACCSLGSRPLLYRHHNFGHHCPFGLRYKMKCQQQQQQHPLARCVDNSARCKKLLPQCLNCFFTLVPTCRTFSYAKVVRPSSVASTIRSITDMLTYPIVYYINYFRIAINRTS